MFFFCSGALTLDASGNMVRSSGNILMPGYAILQIFCTNSSFVDLRHHINNGYEDLEPCFLLS